MSNHILVNSLINCLTDDEDQRQELWLYYLNGNSIESLSDYLCCIKSDSELSEQLQKRIWAATKNGSSDFLQNVLHNFSNVEQSVIILLALGLSVAQISKYKKLAEVRVNCVIFAIKNNEYWKR
jgi:hypothetical protein